MNSIEIYAGDKALKTIKEEGFSAHLFDTFLGASGGPKWFVLAGIDKVLFPEFLSNQPQAFDLIGSSAGAFRTACLAQSDPTAAISRLATKYSSTIYSDKPSVAEITDKGYELLDYVMGSSGITEVLSNPLLTAHFSVAQCHGLVAYENKLKQLSGLARASFRNLRSRKRLAKSFTRAMFSSRVNTSLFEDPDLFPTDFYALNEHNFLQALMASGSIPLILEGVENIHSAKPGMYRDGGIIDYHFDLKFNTDKLVIYPHFYKTPTPGWFDKSLKSRECNSSSYDNVVMICPSDEFVQSLPFNKIPDRKDFEDMPAPQRIAYWQQVISESDRMGDELMRIIQTGEAMDKCLPISLKRK